MNGLAEKRKARIFPHRSRLLKTKPKQTTLARLQESKTRSKNKNILNDSNERSNDGNSMDSRKYSYSPGKQKRSSYLKPPKSSFKIALSSQVIKEEVEKKVALRFTSRCRWSCLSPSSGEFSLTLLNSLS